MKKSELRHLIIEEIKSLNEKSKFSIPGFKKFFEDRLKKSGWYGNKREIKNEADNAISTMKFDMSSGDSLSVAFDKACRDLHIDPDGIESFV